MIEPISFGEEIVVVANTRDTSGITHRTSPKSFIMEMQNKFVRAAFELSDPTSDLVLDQFHFPADKKDSTAASFVLSMKSSEWDRASNTVMDTLTKLISMEQSLSKTIAG